MLAFCVWKVSVNDAAAPDGDYTPPGLCYTPEYYQYVYNEVQNFSETLRQSFPDLESICEHYVSLYGIE